MKADLIEGVLFILPETHLEAGFLAGYSSDPDKAVAFSFGTKVVHYALTVTREDDSADDAHNIMVKAAQTKEAEAAQAGSNIIQLK